MHEEGPVEVLDHVSMPDPVEEKFGELEARIKHLEARLNKSPEASEAVVKEKADSTMRVYNTMSGKKEVFEPLEAGKVGMYACGITVYDNSHIGHARSAIVFDMIRQYLTYRGYDVTFIKNFTDVDDKIINRAKEKGIAWDALARQYTDKYREDMGRLYVEPADVEPLATDHIKEIIEITEGLINKGNAYELEGDDRRRFTVMRS